MSNKSEEKLQGDFNEHTKETENNLPDELQPEQTDSENLEVEEEGIAEENLEGLNKEELFNKLKDILSKEEASPYRNIVNQIKDQYRTLTKEEIEQKKQAHAESKEGEDDEFEYFNTLDDQFESLLKDYNQKRVDQKKKKEKVLNENLKQKKEILEALKALPESSSNISLGFEKLQSLQALWRSIGPVPASYNETLWKNYHFYVGKFFEGVKISNELRDLDQKKNLQLKVELCEKAEALASEPSVKKALDQLNVLQEKWREIGQAGKDNNDTIWERFKAAADKVYEKKKEYVEGVKQKQEQNLAAKTALCERLEKAAEETHDNHNAWQNAQKQVDEIWKEWQSIGYTPKEDNNKTWNRFKRARQKFNEAKDNFYKGARDEQNQNLELKKQLCVEAESLQESTDWGGTANKLKELQRKWKEIGAVSRKDSDKIWKRFRKACDAFFENKTKHFAEKDNQLNQNVAAKEAVIEKINNYSPSEDNKQNLEELKKLQEEWTSAGETPFKEKDRLNASYKKALDKAMNSIKEKTGDGNLFNRLKYDQLKQTPQGQEQMKKERFALTDKIKKLQADVNLWENNLGFFARSKNADAMRQEFQAKIDKAKEEIKKLQQQVKQIPDLR